MRARSRSALWAAAAALNGAAGMAASRCAGGACTRCLACALPAAGVVLLALSTAWRRKATDPTEEGACAAGDTPR